MRCSITSASDRGMVFFHKKCYDILSMCLDVISICANFYFQSVHHLSFRLFSVLVTQHAKYGCDLKLLEESSMEETYAKNLSIIKLL